MKRFAWLVAVALLGWAWLERQALADFPGILSAYSAKEYCSCRFVMGFDQAYCRGYVKQWLPLSSLEEDRQRRLVRATGLGQHNVAMWQSAQAGCRLLP